MRESKKKLKTSLLYFTLLYFTLR